MNKVANDWSIENIWNNLLTNERQQEPRDYIRASELGKSFLDRYLAMKGVPRDNPYPARLLRVFDAGNIFELEVMVRIFKLLGIFIDTYREIYIKRGNYLPVIGHHDPRVGGKINYNQALANINSDSVAPWLKLRATALLESIIRDYPHGMRVLTTEIKTVNSRAFWAKKNQDDETGFFKGYPWHKLQLWTYLQTGDNDGRIFYISKDDLTIKEQNVAKDDKEIEAAWKKDVGRMTYYYRKNIEPPPEKNIIFDENKGEYVLNWKVGWSPYLKRLTGFSVVDDWEKKYYGELKEKNTKNCKICKKPFLLSTLKMHAGVCGRCFTKGVKGGENKNDKHK